jgi:dTDP-glucose 4,6-dehydratase
MVDAADSLLVTGGAGFIGSCFVRRWLRQPAGPVVVLDKLTYAASRQALPERAEGLTFVQGDVADRQLVGQLLAGRRVRQVVHFAAETHVDRSIDSPEPFLQNNVIGTCRLLDSLLAHWRSLPPGEREAFRLVHVSTDEVYGSLGADGLFSESSPYRPSSPYSASKAAADHFVRAYGLTYGLPMIVTHSSNNFGPFQFPEKLIPVMILNALEGRPLPVYGDGQQVRDWIHVEDHCDALLHVLRDGEPGESYNIGGGCERSNLDVVRAVCRLVDQRRPELPHGPCESLIEFVADRPGHDRRYALDTSKIRQQLGWPGAEPLESRLAETVDWYLDHLDWVAAAGSAHRQRRGAPKDK